MHEIEWEDYLYRADLALAGEDTLNSLEKRLGFKLPSTLRLMMAEHGGQAPLNLVPAYPNGKPMTMDCLFHAHADDKEYPSDSPYFGYTALKDDGYGEKVSFSSSGNVYLCLDYNENKANPPVVFIFRDSVAEDPDHKFKLADNFDEFLDKYTVPPDQASA